MKVLITEKLESILQSKWTEFLNKQQLMRLCMEYARDSHSAYQVVAQKEIPPIQTRLSVTKFSITEKASDYEDPVFELWIEFSIPKDNGVIIGTHVVWLDLAGEMILHQTYGTHFVVGTT